MPTATTTKASLENISSLYLYFLAIIPIRSTCTMRPNYAGSKLIGTEFK